MGSRARRPIAGLIAIKKRDRQDSSIEVSWHKNRIFISEVFRFEELGFELITPGYYKAFFHDMDIGELNAEELRFRAARRVV
jgi:hypothetical protein